MKKGLVVPGVVLLVIAPLIVVAGTVYTLMLPNIYVAQTRIAVNNDSTTAVQDSPSDRVQAYDPFFLRTQFEMIQSEPVLDQVIDRLDLRAEWGNGRETLPHEVALAILKNSITVVQERDTSLITIICKRPDPYEAARIANELAETYRDYRMDQATRKLKLKLDSLDKALKEEAQRVDAAEKHFQESQRKVGAPDQMNDAQMQQLLEDHLSAQKEMMDKGTYLKALESTNENNVVEVAKRFMHEPMISGLLQQLKDVDTRLGALDDSFGPNHPEVLRLTRQKEQIRKVMGEQLLTLRGRYQTEYAVAKEKFDQLDKLMAATMKFALPRDQNNDSYKEYRKARADWENELLIYDQLNKRLQLEIGTMDVPDNLVEIIDTAEPNRRPVSPNLFLNILLATAISVPLFLGGLVLLVVGVSAKHA